MTRASESKPLLGGRDFSINRGSNPHAIRNQSHFHPVNASNRDINIFAATATGGRCRGPVLSEILLPLSWLL